MNWESMVRPNIATLQGYESARSLCQKADIFLDANESADNTSGLNRYPSPQPPELLEALAQFYCVHGDQILMGRGIDETIDLIVRTFCRPERDIVLTCPPTYGMYKVAAEIQGAISVSIPMRLQGDCFRLDMQAIEDCLATRNVKIVFVCRPNNPTGEVVSLAQVERLAIIGAGKTLVVVDEAYIEFADEPSAVSLLAKHSNIAVLRTFSKAWALAGARFGVAIGDSGLVTMLKKTSAPYPISTPVVDAIAQNLTTDGISQLNQRVLRCLRQQVELAETLKALPSVVAVFPSHANFLLVKISGSAAHLNQYLKQRGIIIRDRSSDPLLQDCVRISMGTPEELAILLATWSQWERDRHA